MWSRFKNNELTWIWMTPKCSFQLNFQSWYSLSTQYTFELILVVIRANLVSGRIHARSRPIHSQNLSHQFLFAELAKSPAPPCRCFYNPKPSTHHQARYFCRLLQTSSSLEKRWLSEKHQCHNIAWWRSPPSCYQRRDLTCRCCVCLIKHERFCDWKFN